MLKYFVMKNFLFFILFTSFLFSGTFSYEKKKEEILTYEKNGVIYFDIKKILDCLNLSLEPYREGKSFQIHYLDGKLIFGIDSPFIILNDKIQELSSSPFLLEDKIYVPSTFILGPFSALLNTNFKIQGQNLLLQEKIQKQGVSLYNLEVHNVGFTKVVLFFTESISYFMKEGPQQVAIEFPKNIKISIPSYKLEDPFISSISYKGNVLIITFKIRNFFISHYTLSSPFRVILDITKRKEKAKVKEEEKREGFIVIVDPGHGGSDVGATGAGGLQEKDLTLKISLYLKNFLEEKGIFALLTREKDEDISLEERANFANSNKGSLFLSIHNNSFKTYKIRGSETYYISLEPFEELYKTNETEEKTSNIDLILWDLAQNKYLKDSAYFAELVQEELDNLWEIPPRGVKQAPLKVLSGVTMPAALVEIGFISNPEEEKNFQDEEFLKKIAQSLAKAIIKFKETVGERWEEPLEE